MFFESPPLTLLILVSVDTAGAATPHLTPNRPQKREPRKNAPNDPKNPNNNWFFWITLGFIFLILMSCFGLRITEAAATQVIPFLVLTISTVVLFAANDLINYSVAIALLLGTFLGGYVGAHIAITKGDVWIRRLFAVVVVASAARLLWPDFWILTVS